MVSPIGASVATFSERLFAGRHGIVPLDRFDASDMSIKVYAPVCEEFVAEEHFAALELRRLDRYAVFGIVAARQAVAQAGIADSVDPYRLGVHLSSGVGGSETFLNEGETLRAQGPRKVSPMLIPKWIGNMLSGQVSIETGARGAAIDHVAACASSAVSVGEGLRAIRHGYLDAVICGGADAIVQKLPMTGFQNLRALTTSSDPDRASLPFDADRGGFVLGEGGAAVVLESEAHAKARGATILAELKGYGITSDAHHITAPAGGGEAVERAIREALREAGPSEGLVHFNAHGTGTQKNDEVEAEVISRVFGDEAVVTSTKSVTGHLMGAAAAAELIACVLALQEGRIPPTAGTTQLSAGMTIDLVTGAARALQVDRAVSTSLGFGGHNVCLVVDRATGERH